MLYGSGPKCHYAIMPNALCCDTLGYVRLPWDTLYCFFFKSFFGFLYILVLDGVETALVHTLLVLAPSVHTNQCRDVIHNWFVLAESRKILVSPELASAIDELKKEGS